LDSVNDHMKKIVVHGLGFREWVLS